MGGGGTLGSFRPGFFPGAFAFLGGGGTSGLRGASVRGITRCINTSNFSFSLIWRKLGDATAGRVRLFGCPIKMSAFDDPHVRASAPDLDADRARILAELGEPPERSRS